MTQRTRDVVVSAIIVSLLMWLFWSAAITGLERMG